MLSTSQSHRTKRKKEKPTDRQADKQIYREGHTERGNGTETVRKTEAEKERGRERCSIYYINGKQGWLHVSFSRLPPGSRTAVVSG